MVMIINRKIPRILTGNKAQYLGCIILITLSCALFISLNLTGINIVSSLDSLKADYIQEDASFIVETPLRGIEELEKRYAVQIEKRYAVDYQFKPDTTLRILSSTELINRYALIDGNKLNSKTDILIDPGFADAHNISIGDNLKVFESSYKVAGIATTPDYIYPLKNESDFLKNSEVFGIAIVKGDAFNNLEQGYTFYSITGENLDDIYNHLLTNNRVIRWIDRADNMRMALIESDIMFIEPLGKIIPSAILLLTSVMISVIIWRILRKEFPQIGILYALGYKKSEILKHYILIPLILAFTGTVAGTAIGIALVMPFLEGLSSYYHLPISDIDYNLGIIGISLLLPIIFINPVTTIVILNALKLSPLVLMYNLTVNRKPSRLEKLFTLSRFRFNTRFKIREQIRNISRTAIFFMGVVSASALLIMGFSIRDSMNFLMQKNFSESFTYEYHYVFNSIQTAPPGSGETLSSIPAEIISDNSTSIMVYGVQEKSNYINLSDISGKHISLDNIIITKSLADLLDLKEGDKIAVRSNMSPDDFTLEIDKIADFYLGNFIFIPLELLNDKLSLPQNSYLEVYSGKPVDFDASKILYQTDREELETGFQAMLEPLNILMGAIGLIAFTIGLIVIYIITGLVIEENRPTISLLKILGYNKKELYRLILNTGTPLIIAGFLVSIPLILSSLDYMYQVITEEMNMSIPVILENYNYLLAFIIIIATYEAAKFLSRNKIDKIDMSESLKQQG